VKIVSLPEGKTMPDVSTWQFTGINAPKKLPLAIMAKRRHSFQDVIPTRPAVPMVLLQMKRDGNCFFESLSYALFHHGDDGNEIRGWVCDYIETHSDQFKEILEDYVSSYVEHMRKRKTWVNDTEIRVAAELFEIRIWIYVHSSQDWQIVYGGDKGDAFLNYEHHHYTIVLDVSRGPYPIYYFKKYFHFFNNCVFPDPNKPAEPSQPVQMLHANPSTPSSQQTIADDETSGKSVVGLSKSFIPVNRVKYQICQAVNRVKLSTA
jgi:hypothetical protein